MHINDIVLGFAIFGAMLFTLIFKSTMKGLIKAFKDLNKQRDQIKKQQKMKEDLKKNGGFHEWIEIPFEGNNIMVCKHTGWIPSLNRFMNLNYVNAVLKERKLIENIRKYEEKIKDDLALRYNIPRDTIHGIINEFITNKAKMVLQSTIQNIEEIANKDETKQS